MLPKMIDLNYWNHPGRVIAVLMLFIAFFGQTQLSAIDVDPGQDSTYCSGSTITLGGSPTAKSGFPPYKYEWSTESTEITIEGPESANPTVTTPDSFGPATIVFELKVTDKEGFECVETVTITFVKLGEIVFSAPNLPLNQQKITASLSEDFAGATIVWSLEENDIGCNIDDESGEITSGTESGTVMVKASIQDANGNFSCEVTKELCVNDLPCCEVKEPRPFGPLLITFDDAEFTTEEVTSDGYCIYTEIPAKVTLQLLGQFEAEFELPDIRISWEEKIENDEIQYRNVEITWEPEEGLSLTEEIADAVGVKVTKASLMVNASGELTGEVTFEATLNQPVDLIKDALSLKEGLSGTFTYTYMASAPFAGVFNLSGIENITIELYKLDDVGEKVDRSERAHV